MHETLGEEHAEEPLHVLNFRPMTLRHGGQTHKLDAQSLREPFAAKDVGAEDNILGQPFPNGRDGDGGDNYPGRLVRDEDKMEGRPRGLVQQGREEDL